MGKAYEDTFARNFSKAPQYVLVLLGIIVTGGLVVIINSEFTPTLFGFMISLEGFSIGAIYNIVSTNETIRLAGENPAKLNRLVLLSMGLGNISIGFAQLMIGVSLSGDSNNVDSAYDSIFDVMLLISILSIILLLTRALSTINSSREGFVVKNEES